MSDVVVTVPMDRWAEWLEEGDLAHSGELAGQLSDWQGEHEYGFLVGRGRPNIKPGERVYIVAHGHLRGYSPLVRIGDGRRFGGPRGSLALIRRGRARAVTVLPAGRFSVPARINGFQGYRYRWWERSEEIPFPEWRTAGVR